MRTEDFRAWLHEIDKRSNVQTYDNISRIKRIERVFSSLNGSPFDIENECKKDGCQSLLTALTYANRAKMPESISLPSNLTGLKTLRVAVRKYNSYFLWRQEHQK